MFRQYVIPGCVLILAACASPPQIIDAGNGCAVHNPNPKSGERITWSGICQNGFAHGPGTIAWFLDDKPNGRFEGALARGRIEGEGTAHYPSGNHYTGDFLHGQPNGTGTFYFADGRRFEGDWHDGRPEGAGVMYAKDGKATRQTWAAGQRIN
ncbi:MAG: hypothetical protein HOL07_00170 [Rhodospirillaceae bacterium]|jgi:hypothetical protein|nr:hypothetical protein [Rhodospirillaceae bacterium]MBT5356737.1 hypothetical protein [Rhodospirillaceae bacterium]MBT5770779.1 hypothetical protein [Rhodospirillaceae bacterium]MBT6311219.1 hypothetical protein [Rhodospirillaceae bacterium]MBT7364461.1 hypothetical protein [Rhodospirillaceae bacterium]